jgi:hypothetical protein
MKTSVFTDKIELTDGWKRELATTLRGLGLVDDRYTGKIALNFCQGAITDVERTERLK